jgi:hypothetical protein
VPVWLPAATGVAAAWPGEASTGLAPGGAGATLGWLSLAVWVGVAAGASARFCGVVSLG